MAIDGVNKVNKDGRYKLPPSLADKYRDVYLSAAEDGEGRIILRTIDGGD